MSQPTTRILGLDYGSARIGLALGDLETRIASPWAVIDAADTDEVIDYLRALMRQEGIDLIVVGVPRWPHAPQGTCAQAGLIRKFIQRLTAQGWQVVEEDETFSSAQAARHQHERQARGKRDDLAAAVILQTYLERHVSP